MAAAGGSTHPHDAVHYSVAASANVTTQSASAKDDPIDPAKDGTETEGLLAAWMGNALVCASLPPVLIAFGATRADGNHPGGRTLALWFGGLAVLLQLYAMLRYWGALRTWRNRDTQLFAILLLALAAYVYIVVVGLFWTHE